VELLPLELLSVAASIWHSHRISSQNFDRP